MKKILGIILIVLGLASMFSSCIMFDMKTQYIATSTLLLLIGIVIAGSGVMIIALEDL